MELAGVVVPVAVAGDDVGAEAGVVLAAEVALDPDGAPAVEDAVEPDAGPAVEDATVPDVALAVEVAGVVEDAPGLTSALEAAVVVEPGAAVALAVEPAFPAEPAPALFEPAGAPEEVVPGAAVVVDGVTPAAELAALLAPFGPSKTVPSTPESFAPSFTDAAAAAGFAWERGGAAGGSWGDVMLGLVPKSDPHPPRPRLSMAAAIAGSVRFIVSSIFKRQRSGWINAGGLPVACWRTCATIFLDDDSV